MPTRRTWGEFLKPLAVVISDQHWTRKSYKTADSAFRMAIDKAAELGVPLIDCGDIHTDKSSLNADYLNPLVKALQYAGSKTVKVYVLIGNHNLTHERSDDHALHVLKPYCELVDKPGVTGEFNFIPYQHSADKFLEEVYKFPEGSIIFGHQGTIGGQLGDYVKDPASFDPDKVSKYLIWLGHFHGSYKLGTTVSVGTPYTQSFGEANDAPKGFLIVNEDGSYERVLTNLRKHVTVERHVSTLLDPIPNLQPHDLLWIKVTGPRSVLEQLKKRDIGMHHLGHLSFKLDKVYTDDAPLPSSLPTDAPPSTLLDSLIDNLDETSPVKSYLKDLWREATSESLS